MEELIKTVILGIIQGLTEFLPISSTGHLVLARRFFGLSEAGLFLDTMLHFGTLISILLVFWNDIKRLFKRPLSKLLKLIIIGTIPTALIGLMLEDFFEEISRTGATIGWEFIITGLILWYADNYKTKGTKNTEQIKYSDALIIGTLQGAAIFPALSRSGLTIAGSLFRKINREDAAKFSFLLAIPSIFGAVCLQIIKIINGQEILAISSIGYIPIIVGTLAAAIFGYIAVRWMLKILKSGSLKIFSIYVWILGICIIIFQLLGKW